MSKCKNCQGAVGWTTRRSRPLMYCSKKCANDWHKKKNSTRRPGWGDASKKKLKEHEERKKRYKWYCENWVSIKTLMGELQFNNTKILYIAKCKKVPYEVVKTPIQGVSSETFFHPKEADKIRVGLVETPVPDGFLDNKQAAKHLGYSLNTFKTRDRSNLPYKEFRPKSWSEKHIIKIYRPEDLEKWDKELSEKRALEVEENKKLHMKRTRERKARKEREKQEKFECETSGLIDLKAACKMLGIVQLGNYAKKLSPKVLEGFQPRNWYDPKEVERLAKELEEFRNRERKKQYITREISHTAPEAYEKRLLERKFPLWQSDPSKVDSIVLNKKWHNSRVNLGLVKKLRCSMCDQDLPYYNFTYSNTDRGRFSQCRECVKQRRVRTYDPERQKQHRKENYIQKFRSLVACQIKRDMSLVVGEYQDLMVETIWEHIQKTLNYDAQKLCEHLESQFTPKMNWDNHPRSTVGFRWEMDHIIPRSRLKYDSLNHPNFAKCWTLDNLRPLEHYLNKTRKV